MSCHLIIMQWKKKRVDVMGGDKLQILTECLAHKLQDVDATSTDDMIKLEVIYTSNLQAIISIPPQKNPPPPPPLNTADNTTSFISTHAIFKPFFLPLF